MADRPQPDSRSPLADERFAEMYRAHRGAIVRYLRRRLGDDAAEDAAAEVFLRAFRRIGHFDATRGDAAGSGAASALPWLYGFASNIVLERGRAERPA